MINELTVRIFLQILSRRNFQNMFRNDCEAPYIVPYTPTTFHDAFTSELLQHTIGKFPPPWKLKYWWAAKTPASGFGHIVNSAASAEIPAGCSVVMCGTAQNAHPKPTTAITDVYGARPKLASTFHLVRRKWVSEMKMYLYVNVRHCAPVNRI